MGNAGLGKAIASVPTGKVMDVYNAMAKVVGNSPVPNYLYSTVDPQNAQAAYNALLEFKGALGLSLSIMALMLWEVPLDVPARLVICDVACSVLHCTRIELYTLFFDHALSMRCCTVLSGPALSLAGGALGALGLRYVVGGNLHISAGGVDPVGVFKSRLRLAEVCCNPLRQQEA